MTTQMIESYGLDIGYILTGLASLIVIFLIILIILLVRISKLNNRLSKFTSGKQAKNLEEVMLTKFSEIDSIVNNEKKQNKDIKYIAERSTLAFNKIGLVKYNAFREMTGNLSFALAILNDNNTGVVLNSMHSREGCFTYSKEIINGKSYIVLSEEEKEALDIASTIKPNLADDLLADSRSQMTPEEINNNLKSVAKNNVKEAPDSLAKVRKPEDLRRPSEPVKKDSPKKTVADEARVKKMTDEERAKLSVLPKESPTLSDKIHTKPRDVEIIPESLSDDNSKSLVEEIKTKSRDDRSIPAEDMFTTLAEEIKTKPRDSSDFSNHPISTTLSDEIKTKPRDVVIKESSGSSSGNDISPTKKAKITIVESPITTEQLINTLEEKKISSVSEPLIFSANSVFQSDFNQEPINEPTKNREYTSSPSSSSINFDNIPKPTTQNAKAASMRILPSSNYDKKDLHQYLHKRNDDSSNSSEYSSSVEFSRNAISEEDQLGHQDISSNKSDTTIKTNYDLPQ